MNDYHANPELNYKKRWIASVLRDAAKIHPVVVITGARQVGKSTLLQTETPFSEWTYFSLDDYDILHQVKKDPTSLWSGKQNIVVDEVQKEPDLLEAIKLAIDNNPGRYHFMLSGSANLLLMKQVSESLAGRAVYFSLLPMTVGELRAKQPFDLLERLFAGELPDEKDVKIKGMDTIHYLWKGLMPSLITIEDPSQIVRWWEGYVTTYLERDLRQLSQIESLPDFRNLLVALALRCARILNQTEVSRDISINQPTAHRYINLLEVTKLVERLPAYARSRTKRLIKSPKIFFADPGLVSYLCGHYNTESLSSSREIGGIFESFIYLHLRALAELLTPVPKIYYWRTTTGKEVDFIIEWGKKLVAIEVKLSDKIRYSDTANLQLFLEEYPETVAGLVVYSGNKRIRLHEKIVCVPWHILAGF